MSSKPLPTWHYTSRHGTVGPVTKEQLKSLYSKRTISKYTQIWNGGSVEDWSSIQDVGSLWKFLSTTEHSASGVSELEHESDLDDGKEETITCDVCCHNYDEKRRTPKILPCGHTFCKECLEALIVKRIVKCPTCRRRCAKKDMQTTNFALLSILENASKRQYVCSKHGEKLILFCKTDQVQICALCQYHGLHEGHDIAIAAQEQTKLHSEVQSTFRKSRLHLNELKQIRKDLDIRIAAFSSTIKSLEHLTNISKDEILSQSESAHNILGRADQMISIDKKFQGIVTSNEIGIKPGEVLLPVQMMRLGQADIGDTMTILSAREISMRMIASLGLEKCDLIGKRFALVEQEVYETENPKLEDLKSEGTLCEIVHVEHYLVYLSITYTVQVLEKLVPIWVSDDGCELRAKIV